ncbi:MULTISPECIES: TetR/AcrR family transcriptional regulator [unclassified Psychrobacter]|uniref:TetR/AcrR family transcriptional regulator n=1 Tax=unclassified Psychrobacter TaxID=196806 RepID=UPI00078C888B|nr:MULTISPECIES: TetR/AcrR family transcriptional regulator [unclassified Psychrobacter]AMN49840.1 TetR family transcriptional regulator [Psychrobacter sp. P2G3]AMN67694.1 TetR family transcriptional regulator [Psychrobacter sp. P11G5]
MSDHRDDKIEDILVDSELAKKLVPNKFKFTSQQGRVRRQKLLMGAKKLSETRAINDISLADVCEEAGIPRASAYHFFPNIEAIFLALRFLNAIEILEILTTVETVDYDRWQGYLTALIQRCVNIFHDDQTKAKLIYDTNTPDFEGDSFGEDMDHQIVELVYKRLSERYEMPKFEDIQDILLVTYSIINGVFTLSYRRHASITDNYLQEATTASIAYLRCYLPEKLPRKNR